MNYMDTKYFQQAMHEQGYSDFAALPPHEQSRIMRRAQDLKAAAAIVECAETFIAMVDRQQTESRADLKQRVAHYQAQAAAAKKEEL
jgi:hypothetical protein